MATNEPMSEQALTMICELLADDGRQWDDYSPQELYRVGWSAELLLAEVDRLRAREQALEAENAAMRSFAEALRDYAGLKRYADLCEWCGAQGQSVGSHTPDCLVTAAATFLTKHPATATAGEAVESEPVAGVTFADTDGNDPEAYDEVESEGE